MENIETLSIRISKSVGASQQRVEIRSLGSSVRLQIWADEIEVIDERPEVKSDVDQS